MAAPAIHARGLGKDYLVGVQRGYRTLRESLSDAAGAPARALRRRPASSPARRLLRALDAVDLDVQQGESVGFIGHNGAGKSTLLKVLTRVTEPDRGFAEVRGRVGSLLEVGTGFHPELTGRENIFLNGAVLGMSRHETRRRFDEIVDFADVERFLDTPVKRYSSGMYVRLAFSVAAHLEPEVLVVDEVLAVGDAAFQRKSVARMGEVARQGRTVLFVSHNMAVIQALCTRAVVLQTGGVVADGPVADAVATYLGGLEAGAGQDVAARTDRSGRLASYVTRVTVAGGLAGVPRSGEPLEVRVVLNRVLRGASVALHVHNQLGAPVLTLDSGTRTGVDRVDEGAAGFCCRIEALTLVPGSYRIDVTVTGDGYVQDSIPGAALFAVEQGVLDGRPVLRGGLGDVAVAHRWVVPAAVYDGGGE